MKYLKIFTDFISTLDELKDDEAGRLFRAMLKYADDGVEPVLDGNERYVWGFARLTIDRTRDYSASKAEAGRIGGLARSSKTKQTLAEPSKTKQTVANPSLKEKKRKEIEIISKEITKKFVPPDLEEIVNYIREQGYTVDAEKFLNYYTSNGWLIGKTLMKDWKAAVRSWQSREPKRTTQYKNADLERLEIQL